MTEREYFNTYTKYLLLVVQTLGLSKAEKTQLTALINIMRASFVDPLMRRTMFGMADTETPEYPSCGFCRIASECVYRLMGGATKWSLMQIPKGTWSSISHYYLLHNETKKVLDLTADQVMYYGNMNIPYEKFGRKVECADDSHLSKFVMINKLKIPTATMINNPGRMA